MRAATTSPLLLLLLLLPLPAQAMNWEGHDDWMADMEPAVVYESSAPHASPRPGEGCPVSQKKVQDNPYEQIPLDQHGCPVPSTAPEAGQ